MTTVNSISGGKTSAYMAMNYPADVNIFSCVCIDYPKAAPKDPVVMKYCLDKLSGNFIASAEHDKTLRLLMDLEQILGKEIVWVRGKSFDQVIDEAGCLPTWARRFCTTEMKLLPMFEYLYPRYGVTKTQIGFRFDESHRAYAKVPITDTSTVQSLINFDGQDIIYEDNKPVFVKVRKDRSTISFPINCNNFGERLQNWEHDFVYQLKEYPLIDEIVFLWQIRAFLKEKYPWLVFPPDSNCLGCHHKPAWLIKRNYEDSPAHLEWFAIQETKKFWTEKEVFHTWHDGRGTYSEIFEKEFQDLLAYISEEDLFAPDINSEIFKMCSSGGCTD